MNVDNLVEELKTITASLDSMNNRLGSIITEPEEDPIVLLKKFSGWLNRISAELEKDWFETEEGKEVKDAWELAEQQFDTSKLLVALRRLKTRIDDLLKKLAEAQEKEPPVKSREFGKK